MNIKKSIAGGMGTGLLGVQMAFAQASAPFAPSAVVDNFNWRNPPAHPTAADYLNYLHITYFLAFVGLVAMLVIFLGCIHFIDARNDVQAKAKAKHSILYGIVSLVITFLCLAYATHILISP